MPWADSRNTRLYYEVDGEGPAVLFAHGAGGNTASWWQQVPEFARTHRVITFDHRGFGRSTCAPEHFDPAQFENDALAVLDAAGADRAAVVCQSMGGWTGVRLAVHHPSRVTKLVLANTPGAIHTEALIEQMRTLGLPRPAGSDLTTFTLGEPFRRTQPAGTRLYRAISAFNVTPMPIDRLTRRESFVDSARLKPFPVPVLMIASTHDVTFPLALLQATARTIGARIEVVDGAGHSTYRGAFVVLRMPSTK